MKMIENKQLKLARDFVQFTGKNVFLTGKAGTGKTTFLHSLKQQSGKRMIVVAPTGVAAINAGGVTIHSFFQMPFGPIIPNRNNLHIQRSPQNGFFRKFSKEKINIIRGLDLLVIDEISMVRADLLDGIDEVLRRYKNRNLPFGGVQLLMIGDLHQLAPVIKEDEWILLKDYYETGFFFSSLALQKTDFISINLKEIFRQSDPHFIDLLNKIRENKIDDQVRTELNKRYQPDFQEDNKDGYITLTTHNSQAQLLNGSKLEELSGKTHTFRAYIKGDFPVHMYPTEEILKLKTGAQVMFVKNDRSTEKRYFNGKIGEVIEIDDGIIYVKCKDEDDIIEVEEETWDNLKYTLDENTKEIEEKIAGTFSQHPLKLAWAITIHKSQGLTFDRAIIDAQAAFTHGQVYVALSRCRSLDGLVLSTPLNARSIITNNEILHFTDEAEKNQPDEGFLLKSKYEFQLEVLLSLFDFSELHWLVTKCIKITNEHSNILVGDLNSTFVDMINEGRQKIQLVSDKFKVQINKIAATGEDLESNDHLQERIKEGSRYFLRNINDIIDQPISSLSIETDNKLIRKSLGEAIDKLLHYTGLKSACLEKTLDKFILMEVLKVRAEAAINVAEISKRKRSNRNEELISNVKYQKLYEQLKTWRSNYARKLNLSPGSVISLKTLIHISNSVPDSMEHIKSIPGVGKKTYEKIDKEFLEILTTYRNQNDIEKFDYTSLKKLRDSASSTLQKSFDLFKSGKRIDEIVLERGLARSTIENHLSHFVGTGEISLDKLISTERADTAIKYFKQAENMKLTPAKEFFGNEYTFGELRMILQHILYENSSSNDHDAT